MLALLLLPARAAATIGKPVAVRVEFYRIAVELAPEKQQLEATTTIGLRALGERVRAIPFEIENTLEIQSVRDDRNRTLAATRLGPRYSHSYLLELPEPLEPGEPLEIEFHYSGRMPEKPLDYVASYGVLLRDESRWYPIIDLSSVAGLEMRVTVPEGWEAVTSGDLMERSTAAGKSTFFWRADRPVSSRSLAAGPLRRHVRHLDGLDLYVYLATADEVLATSLADRLSDVLRFYGSRFGAYPWKRYSVVEGLPQPTGSTGYSAPGFLVASLQALRNHRYLNFDPQFLPHEVAHQWFPGEVTMASETDAFIAESLAEYCALLYLEGLLPPPAFRSFVRRSHLEALAQELVPLAPGLRIFGWYDWPTVYRTLYQRGMLVYCTLDALLGEEAFLRLLREFYSRYQGRAASVANFQALAEEIHGGPLAWFFDSYLKRTDLPEMSVQLAKTAEGLTGHLQVANVPPDFLLPVEVEIPLQESRNAPPGQHSLRALVLARRGENTFTIEKARFAGQATIDPEWKILFWREEAKRARAVARLLARADEASRKGERRAARKALRQALAADPNDLARQRLWVNFSLGRRAFQERRYAASLLWMQRALERESYDPAFTGKVRAWARIFRGYALERSGQRRAALAEYRKALTEAEPPALASPFDLEEFGRMTSAREEVAARLAHPLPTRVSK